MNHPICPTLALLILTAHGNAADLAFSTTTQALGTGVGATVVASIDMDGDGNLDLAVGNPHTGHVSNNRVVLWENDGMGGMTIHSLLPLLARPTDIHAADLDGDGDQDLVVSAFTPGNSASVFLGNGTGLFPTRVDYYVAAIPTGLSLGDLNGDGLPDLAMSLRSIVDRHVGVLLNDGLGGFGGVLERYQVGSGPEDVTMADLDGDGDLDLVSVDYNANQVSVLQNDGVGLFSSATAFDVGNSPQRVAAGDVDNDGDLDLAVSNSGSAFVTLLWGDGNGGFPSSTQVPNALQGVGLALSDLDGDDRLDIAVGMGFTQHVNLFRNLGSGMFTNASPATTGDEPRSVIAADLDGDGDLDLATANDGIGGLASISVLRNDTPGGSGAAFCFGDGSGAICPCNGSGATGEGCSNTTGSGALLLGTGTASFSADTFGFSVSGMPPGKAGLCVKGSSQQAGGIGLAVGDGLLCTNPQLRSQVITSNQAGELAMSSWRGQGFGSFPGAANAGTATYYQWWYRDPAAQCTGLGFNFTNAWEVVWLP